MTLKVGTQQLPGLGSSRSRRFLVAGVELASCTRVSLIIVAALALAGPCQALRNSRPSYLYSAPDDSRESHESHESLEVLRLAPVASIKQEEDYGPAKYDFNYAVRDAYSGNDFGHQEVRDGDRTDGSYSVQLPDGRLQKVTYYVDGDSGFVAEVTYEGEARYPEPDSVEAAPYSAPAAPVRVVYSAPDSLEDHSAEDDSVEVRYARPVPLVRTRYTAPASLESHSAEDDSVEVRYVKPAAPVRVRYTAPAPVESQSAEEDSVEARFVKPAAPVRARYTAPAPVRARYTAPAPVESQSAEEDSVEARFVKPAAPVRSRYTAPTPVRARYTAPAPVEVHSAEDSVEARFVKPAAPVRVRYTAPDSVEDHSDEDDSGDDEDDHSSDQDSMEVARRHFEHSAPRAPSSLYGTPF
ncbi:uncharacterized protein LOC143037080 [Oratosquilla oratoria]|uniref:uncharacterized protein LOC143037080 n=1 Tax=Oratosquilla oratoria TaxID=337810 RepID=UPI003F75D9D9